MKGRLSPRVAKSPWVYLLDSVLVLENHNLFVPVIVGPAPEHTAAVEIKHYSPLPINQLYTDDASLPFASLAPAISSRPL